MIGDVSNTALRFDARMHSRDAVRSDAEIRALVAAHDVGTSSKGETPPRLRSVAWNESQREKRSPQPETARNPALRIYKAKLFLRAETNRLPAEESRALHATTAN